MSNQDALNTLKSMDAFFSSEDKWIKGLFAITNDYHHIKHNVDLIETKTNIKCACLVGALTLSHNNDLDLYNQVYDYMIDAIQDYTGEIYNDVEAFNDDPDTSFEDIKTIISTTIADIERIMTNVGQSS